MLRDFEYWHPRVCNEIERRKREELIAATAKSRKSKPSHDVRIGIRVTVWQCLDTSRRASGDIIYWVGIPVAIVQLGIAAIPWGLYGQWLIFLVTAVGTVLAFASGSLPQWAEEKFGVRHVDSDEKQKDIILTTGNGAHDALLILGCKGGLDLEALAAPYRELRAPWLTRILLLTLAVLWILLLITCAGFEEHTWYLVGVGMIGILHNVCVAGMPRQPKGFGIDLQYVDTFADGKVMEVLWSVEESYPRAGAALIGTFFPGELFPREKLLWDYAERRYKAWKNSGLASKRNPKEDAWKMPPLRRPPGCSDDNDVPSVGEYMLAGTAAFSEHPIGEVDVTPRVTEKPSQDHVIDMSRYHL